MWTRRDWMRAAGHAAIAAAERDDPQTVAGESGELTAAAAAR